MSNFTRSDFGLDVLAFREFISHKNCSKDKNFNVLAGLLLINLKNNCCLYQHL